MIDRLRNSPSAVDLSRILAYVCLAVLAVLVGKAVVANILEGYLILAICIVFAAMPFADSLAVAVFWTLPYMVVNLPTGAFTLKLPEAVAYTFTTAYLLRQVLQRQPIRFPPATAQVIVYLAVICLSIAAAPAIPIPFAGPATGMDRNGPNIRPISLFIWLGLSWLVVVALYNKVGKDSGIFARCVRAHILGGGLASAISLGIYVLALGGLSLRDVAGSGSIRNLAVNNAGVIRLAGVAYEPLFLGFYLITVIPITLMAVVNGPATISRKWSVICLALQSIAMVLTFSSGGWAGLAVALIAMAPFCRWERVPKKLKKGMVTAVIVAICAFLLTVLLNTKLFLMVGYMATKITQGNDIYRQREWNVAKDLSQRFPLLGCGPGLANFYFPKYHELVNSVPLVGVIEINSVFFNAIAETGFLGLIAIGWCTLTGLGRLLTSIRCAGPQRCPTLVALTASLLGCFVQYISVNPLFLIYFSALVGLSTAAAYRTDIDDKPDPLLAVVA